MASINRDDYLRFRARLQDVNSDKERLELIWQDYRAQVEARTEQKPAVEKSEKDVRAAQDLKEKGNRFYVQNKLREALLSYNEALCKAPKGSPLIPVLYANRSAVYFQDGLNLQALENIELAIEHGYPVEKRDKLEERRTRCLNLMARLPDAKVYIQPKPALEPLLSHEAHPKFPFLSKAVDIKMDADRGPILVAQKELKICDIFFKEPVFLKAIDSSDDSGPYGMCALCIKTNFLSLIPCTECSVALFCKDCLPKADDVHRFECSILKRMYSMSESTPSECPNIIELIVRSIIQVIRLFGIKNLDRKIFNLQTKKAKLLEGDYNNDIERQIIKWIFVRSEEATLDEWANFGTSVTMYMDLIMLSPPLKALISTPARENAILNVLFHLLKQELVAVNNEDGFYFTFQPMQTYFSMENCGAEVNSQINPKRYNFIYCIRPIRKDKEIKFRFKMAIIRHAVELDVDSLPNLMNELSIGNSGPYMAQFRSTLIPEFQRMNKKIQNFDEAAEMAKAIIAIEQSIKKLLKEKERLIQLLTDNDAKFPCFDIAVVQWHLTYIFDILHTDLEFIARSSMMPNISKLVENKAVSMGYKF